MWQAASFLVIWATAVSSTRLFLLFPIQTQKNNLIYFYKD